ncbi:MAG: hypothetical protein LBT62_05520 [Deltaproteobacteria bacterium]|jgi:type II secretory pathway pseudopilin PulG|nr:hypothetical protein [Deltaproteobacteria bacterium]
MLNIATMTRLKAAVFDGCRRVFSPSNKLKRTKPAGMILITTLVVMLLLTIMGAGVLWSSRAELTTTTNYKQNMKAFNHADAVVEIGIKAVDALVSRGDLDDVKDHLSYNSSSSGYKISVSDNLRDLITDKSSSRISMKERYLNVGAVTTDAPDIVVRDAGGNLVGTVMISNDLMQFSEISSFSVGNSQGIIDKGSTGGGALSKQYYVITVSGRDPAVKGSQSFFSLEDDEMALSGPQTFITVLYSVVTGG